MKLKITKPNGTTIEAEGTAEELERVARAVEDGVPFWKQPFPVVINIPVPSLPPPCPPIDLTPQIFCRNY